MLFYGKRNGTESYMADEIAPEQEDGEAGRAVDELLEFRSSFSIGTAPVTANGEGRDVFPIGELCREVVEEGEQDCESTQTRT